MIVIPKIFHSIWVGDNPFPKEFVAYQQSWLELHPGWELKFWTEGTLPKDLVRKEIYETLRVPAERADMLRLEVLWRFGGIYMDTDFECLRNFDELIDGLDFFVADLKPGRINNAFIGATPKHPILTKAIQDLKPRKFYGYDKAAAGPTFLDKIVKQFPGTKIFEPWVMYPASPVEMEKAYANHRHARSWQDTEGFIKAAERAENRLFLAQQQLYETHKTLTKVRQTNRLETVHREVDKLLHKITFHEELPLLREKQGVIAMAKSKVKSKAKKIKGQVKKFLVKRVLRGAYRLRNMGYRFTYTKRLDKVLDRNEIPVVLNKKRLVGKAVEIGVKTGSYSQYMLKRWKGARLISVDPWMEDAPENYVDHANVAQSKHEKFYEMTKSKLAEFGGRSDIWRMTSEEAAKKVRSKDLDFVYIDARHDYDSVKEDLQLWFDKVRPGGIIAGHDYADGMFPQGNFGVKRAVDEFFAEKGLKVNTTEGKWPVEMFPSWLVEIPGNENKSNA